MTHWFPMVRAAVLMLSFSSADAQPPPLVPHMFFYDDQHSGDLETHVLVGWTRVFFATEYRLYRKRESVIASAAAARLLGNQPPPLEDWQEIYRSLYPLSQEGGFTDGDIPPPTTRSLGAVYCYKVRAYWPQGFVEAQPICRRQRGINQPKWPLSLEALSPTSLRVSWHDRSSLETGFLIRYGLRRAGTPWKTIVHSEAGDGSVVIDNLESRREYCVWVAAFDFYGRSLFVKECKRTL